MFKSHDRGKKTICIFSGSLIYFLETKTEWDQCLTYGLGRMCKILTTQIVQLALYCLPSHLNRCVSTRSERFYHSSMHIREFFL